MPQYHTWVSPRQRLTRRRGDQHCGVRDHICLLQIAHRLSNNFRSSTPSGRSAALHHRSYDKTYLGTASATDAKRVATRTWHRHKAPFLWPTWCPSCSTSSAYASTSVQGRPRKHLPCLHTSHRAFHPSSAASSIASPKPARIRVVESISFNSSIRPETYHAACSFRGRTQTLGTRQTQ